MADAKSLYNIAREEYETERHVFDMWRWINVKLGEMKEAPCFDKIYFDQKGENVKQLIEEALPMASLGLSFIGPADDVYVRCLTGNQSYDAELRVTGHRNLCIRVEVTTTETPETVFAREELSKKGFVHRPARFEKTDNGKIPLPPVMADMVQQYDEWIDVALKRAENKVTSGKYNPNTAILVRVDNWAPLPMNFRVDLVNKTRERLGGELNQVYGVYYLHRNVIDEVEGHRTGR